MIVYSARVDLRPVSRRARRMIQQTRQGLRDAGRLLLEASREEAPKRTGRMASGLRFGTTIDRGPTIELYLTGSKVASYVLGGTRPHVIEARRGRALRFEWDGRTVFFRRVNHPGTKPNPFTIRAYRRVRREMIALIARALAS